MEPVAAVFLVLAVGLIALGRYHVRRSRVRRAAVGKGLGWALTAAGFLCMLMGVILW